MKNFKLKIFTNLVRIKFEKIWYSNRYEQLQAKKWHRFQSLLKKSPFYRSGAMQNQELRDYPLMNKAKFMEYFNEINTCGIDKQQALDLAIKAEVERDFSPMINDITVGLSSGTSGNKGIFLASESERAHWVAIILDRVISFSLKPRKVAFFLRANSNLYSSVKSKLLQFEFFDLLVPLENQIDRLNKLHPELLVAQPSLLLELANQVEMGKLTFQPKKIISVAEVLYPEDSARLSKVFKQIIHQVYQCTEGFLASTCEYGTLHFNEDFLIIEKQYLDDEKKRFHPIITDLVRRSQPIVRYELNDIIHEKSRCKCGSSWLAIEQIEGRSDDILRFETTDGTEVKIYPDFFRRAIIISDSRIQNYALIQEDLRTLQLFVEGTSEMYNAAHSAIEALLMSKDITQVRLEKIEVLKNEKGSKLRRIKSNYVQTH